MNSTKLTILNTVITVVWPACEMPKATGNCQGSLPRFYFDLSTRTCQPFVFTGCEGNSNNFESFVECEEACPTKQSKWFVLSLVFLAQIHPVYLTVMFWLCSCSLQSNHHAVCPKSSVAVVEKSPEFTSTSWKDSVWPSSSRAARATPTTSIAFVNAKKSAPLSKASLSNNFLVLFQSNHYNPWSIDNENCNRNWF